MLVLLTTLEMLFLDVRLTTPFLICINAYSLLLAVKIGNIHILPWGWGKTSM
jgi:hypothetical protein